MTLPSFPSLPTIGFPKRSIIQLTGRQPSIGGQETRIAYWSYPRYRYEYSWEVLRQNAGLTEADTLAGFYNARGGPAGFFGYVDPDDFTVTNQALGTGDGVTTVFQLVRSRGGFTEPVFVPSVVPVVYRTTAIGVEALSSAVRTNFVRNPRAEGAVAGTPGTQPTDWSIATGPGLVSQIIGTGTASGVPYVDIRVSGTSTGFGLACNIYLDNANASAALNQSWTLSAWVQLTAGTLPGALELHIGEYSTGTSYFPGTAVAAPAAWSRTITTTTVTDPVITVVDGMVWVYVPGAQAVDLTLRIGGPQLETGSVATSLILPLVGSPAVTTVQDFILGATGQIVFSTAPANGIPLTWTGTYAWLCRFDDDNLDFNKIFDFGWSVGSLKFTTEKL